MSIITTSVFDLFKIGPGPSSSHTIGPMRIGRHYLALLRDMSADKRRLIDRIEIRLFGSLSATGQGHGTDRAVIAGLLDWTPEETDPDEFTTLLDNDAEYMLPLDGSTIIVSASSIIYDEIVHDHEFSNTLIVSSWSGPQKIHELTYYSVGGGFIQWDGQNLNEEIKVDYPYRNMKELKVLLRENDIPLHELVIRNEMSITGHSREQILEDMQRIIDAMDRAVNRGIATDGVLPGTIELSRKAPNVYRRAQSLVDSPDRFLIFLNAYSLAASEENAAGNIVVTAPTSGASGVIPGVLYVLRHHFRYPAETIINGMFAAATIGFLVKHNASISGAEAGCMGEVGTAAGMAAAMLTYCANEDIHSLECAAEIAIEHHLGMTCDPVGGYVQIPCIERNAVGAVKAYNAYLLATSGDPGKQKISLDQVIDVVRETGRDMSKKYKETSQGGLALNLTEC
jgi:L-serine dehydratase